jgi:hypothetical protein
MVLAKGKVTENSVNAEIMALFFKTPKTFKKTFTSFKTAETLLMLKALKNIQNADIIKNTEHYEKNTKMIQNTEKAKTSKMSTPSLQNANL